MSVEANKAVVRRYVEEVINAGNLDRLGEFMTEDGIDHAAPAGMPQGVQGAKMFLGMFFGAFPDHHYTIEDMLAEDDKVTIRSTITGTHTEPFMGMPPTGKSFAVQCLETLRFVNGKYVEHWGGIDNLGMMMQLGLMGGPRDAKAADEIRALAQYYIDSVSKDDREGLAATFAENFLDHNNAQVTGLSAGLQGVIEAHHMLHESFPDLRFSLDDAVVNGDVIAIRVSATGTHQGPFYGIPPTGKPISWTAMRILRVENGKFAEGWNEFDQVGILQQLGIIPSFEQPSSPEANAALVRKVYEEENKGNIDFIDQAFAPEFVMHGDSLNPLQKGVGPLKDGIKMSKEAFPDMQVTIEDLVAEGDKVVTRLRWRGTNTKSFMGIPATNHEMTWTAIALNRLEKGKIVERWFNSDVFSILQQLGLVPAM